MLVLLLVFIAIQPVIDVLTLASMYVIDSSITVGVVVRALYMLVMVGLLLWLSRKSKASRLLTIYLIGLAILLAVNVGLNMQVKDPYYLFQEIKFFNKVIYFHIVLLGLMMVYKELKNRDYPIAEKTTKYFWVSGLIIASVFIVAQITGTSLSNYAYTKVGFSGWFYAGNEIGAIMAIVLPIMALYAIERTDSLKKPWAWIPFVMMSFGMLALGTKVGYGGIIIVLLSVLIGSAIMWLSKQKNSKVISNLMISFVLTVVLILITPFTPVFGNMFAHFDSLGIDFSEPAERPGDSESQEGMTEEEIAEEEAEEIPEITQEQVQNLVFSSREKYEAVMRDDFFSAPLSQQLFGMGFAGNYDVPKPGSYPKMIEMDFHDWFYSFGFIGFFYIMLPLVWFAGRFVIRFVTNIKTYFTYFNILYGVSFLLGMGIAYTAGHVLTAPAVSIYLAAALAMLSVKEKFI